MATQNKTQSSAGTRFELAKGEPDTWNAAGFAAQEWVDISKVKNGGAFGKKFELIVSSYLSQRGKEKKKGTFDAGSLDLQIDVKTDAGQTLCAEALDDDDDYSVRIRFKSGNAYYMRGLVTEFVKTIGGPNDMFSGNIKVELQPIFTEDGEEVAVIAGPVAVPPGP